MSSNSSEEEKRIALANITNRIINERISYENSYDGEKNDAYYEKIVSIERPLFSIIRECDLSTFITDKELKRALDSYSSSISELSGAIGKGNIEISEIIDNRNVSLVTLYRKGYLRIPEDEYKKCCETYIENKLSEGFYAYGGTQWPLLRP